MIHMRTVTPTIRATLLLFLLGGCDKPPVTAREGRPMPQMQRLSYTIARDPARRDAQEAAATTRLLAMLREPDRTDVRRRLESSDWNTQTSLTAIPDNAEATAILGEIYAIKEARLRDVLAGEQRELAHLVAAPVTIAVWNPPDTARYAALVVRTPGGNGRNIILLAPGEVGENRLAQALRILARSRATDGEFASVLVRRYLKGNAPEAAAAELAAVTPLVAQLQAAARLNVPGYGELPAIQITVAPVPRSGAARR